MSRPTAAASPSNTGHPRYGSGARRRRTGRGTGRSIGPEHDGHRAGSRRGATRSMRAETSVDAGNRLLLEIDQLTGAEEVPKLGWSRRTLRVMRLARAGVLRSAAEGTTASARPPRARSGSTSPNSTPTACSRRPARLRRALETRVTPWRYQEETQEAAALLPPLDRHVIWRFRWPITLAPGRRTVAPVRDDPPAHGSRRRTSPCRLRLHVAPRNDFWAAFALFTGGSPRLGPRSQTHTDHRE